jgi:polar amino acid transport system substrate-binding protein
MTAAEEGVPAHRSAGAATTKSHGRLVMLLGGWRLKLAGLAVALSAGLLAAAGVGATTLEDVKAAGKITVGTEAAYAPFEFVQDGKIVGYDKDVLDRIIAAWGVELEQLDVPFAGILTGLDQGKYDLVATALIMNPERAAKYAFTMPVALAQVAIMKRKGDDKVTSVDDLSGLTIGGPVPPSGPTSVLTNYNEELKAAGKGAEEIAHFPGDPELFLALANGQIDGAVETMLVINEAIKKQPDTFEVVGTIGDPFYIGWVVRPDDTQLRDAINEEIRKLRDSGELSKLQKQWFGFEMPIPDSGYLPEGAK